MDQTELVSTMQLANTIIASHGMAAHIRDNNREYELRIPSATDQPRRRYEFILNPSKPSYYGGNFSVSIVISYEAEADREVAEEVRRYYKRSLTLSSSGMDIPVEKLQERESFIQHISMLASFLGAALPTGIDLVVLTKEEKQQKLEAQRKDEIARRIITDIGIDNLKGLRTGGAERVFRLSESYVNSWGSLPADDVYVKKHVRLYDRRGNPKDFLYYRLRVVGGVVRVSRIEKKCKVIIK